MAYVIQTQRTNDPVKALVILNRNKHFPNKLVVKHGSVLLEKPEMNAIIEEFHRRVHEAHEQRALDSTDLSLFQ